MAKTAMAKTAVAKIVVAKTTAVAKTATAKTAVGKQRQLLAAARTPTCRSCLAAMARTHRGHGSAACKCGGSGSGSDDSRNDAGVAMAKTADGKDNSCGSNGHKNE